MFYGIIQENYIYEDCLLEINIKDIISNIKTKIRSIGGAIGYCSAKLGLKYVWKNKDKDEDYKYHVY